MITYNNDSINIPKNNQDKAIYAFNAKITNFFEFLKWNVLPFSKLNFPLIILKQTKNIKKIQCFPTITKFLVMEANNIPSNQFQKERNQQMGQIKKGVSWQVMRNDMTKKLTFDQTKTKPPWKEKKKHKTQPSR